MSNERTTQAVELALVTYEPDARTTQAAVLSLVQFSAASRTTQGVALALVDYFNSIRTTQAVALALVKSVPCVTTEAQCWEITRRDGVVLAYTTHDESLLYLGRVFKPCASLRATAISESVFSGASTGDVQATGILDDEGVSAEDIYAGRYDDARVRIYTVDWMTGDGRLLQQGVVAKTEQGSASYEFTVLTAGARLEQRPLLAVVSPLCSHELGDAQCGVNVAALSTTSAVESTVARNVVNASANRQFFDSTLVVPPATFVNARLLWNTGPNAGLTSEVKDVTDGFVTLWYPTPNIIEIGDSYTIAPACDKSRTTCATIYNNVINHGGFPDVPGSDLLNETPTR